MVKSLILFLFELSKSLIILYFGELTGKWAGIRNGETKFLFDFPDYVQERGKIELFDGGFSENVRVGEVLLFSLVLTFLVLFSYKLNIFIS